MLTLVPSNWKRPRNHERKTTHLYTFIMKEQPFQRIRSINRNRHSKHLFEMTIYPTLSRDQTLATAKSTDAIEQGRWVKTPLTFWCNSETFRNSVILFGNSHVGLLGDCRWFKGSPRKGFSWSPTSPHHQLIEPTMESVGRTFKMGYWCPEVRSRALLDCLSLLFFPKQNMMWPLCICCALLKELYRH